MASVQSSLDADEVDLSGLIESIVDSDEEEDLAESMDVSDNSSSRLNQVL
jgi:Rap guanine nucleotide exchange factor 2